MSVQSIQLKVSLELITSLFIFLKNYFMYVKVSFCMHIYMCPMCMSGVQGGQKKGRYPETGVMIVGAAM